jgi:hypothetical protein
MYINNLFYAYNHLKNQLTNKGLTRIGLGRKKVRAYPSETEVVASKSQEAENISPPKVTEVVSGLGFFKVYNV